MPPNNYISICEIKVMYAVLYCLTNRGVYHGVRWGPDPLKICRRVRVCFFLILTPKMSHSFIQNCCWITRCKFYIMNDETLV